MDGASIHSSNTDKVVSAYLSILTPRIEGNICDVLNIGLIISIINYYNACINASDIFLETCGPPCSWGVNCWRNVCVC